MDPRLLTVLVVAALSAAQGLPQGAVPEVADEEASSTSGEKRAVQEHVAGSSGTLGAKLNVRFPEETKEEEKKEDEAVRAPRQSSGVYGYAPTTTVCIQVRSDHQPQVVCGPQVDEKKDVPDARYAYPETYFRAAPPRYAQQIPPPAAMAPSAPPPPITIYPARRREEMMEHVRVVAPPPTPVVYQRPLYQPVAYPLRLNCGVQPEAAYLSSPLLRSSASFLGYYPVGEQVITLQDTAPSSGAGAPPGHSVYSSSLRSMTSADPYIIQESPYPYSSWSYDSGYYPDMMQGRSVDQSSGYPDSSSLQELEMKQARQRLRMLQGELLAQLNQSTAEEESQRAAQGDDSKTHVAADQEPKRQSSHMRGPGKRHAQSKA